MSTRPSPPPLSWGIIQANIVVKVNVAPTQGWRIGYKRTNTNVGNDFTFGTRGGAIMTPSRLLKVKDPSLRVPEGPSARLGTKLHLAMREGGELGSDGVGALDKRFP